MKPEKEINAAIVDTLQNLSALYVDLALVHCGRDLPYEVHRWMQVAIEMDERAKAHAEQKGE